VSRLAGIGPRDVVSLVRRVQAAADDRRPIVVTGMLATELAKLLAAGAEPGVVRVGRSPDGAAALVVMLGGPPSDTDLAAMRAATRALVPVVAVQTDPRANDPIPYVLAGDVISCPPGQGFPVADIAAALARLLGHDGVALAARLPALRESMLRELVRSASLQAAALAALPLRKGALFPILTLLQARLVLDLAAAHGREVGQGNAPELAAVTATGLGLRALARSLPRRLPLVGATTGFLGTRALGEAALRRFGGGR
jgi:uncharacterized protein (DUF697 family)